MNLKKKPKSDYSKMMDIGELKGLGSREIKPPNPMKKKTKSFALALKKK